MSDPAALIDAWLDGSITEADFAALSDWLAADPDHADQFAARSLLHRHMSEFNAHAVPHIEALAAHTDAAPSSAVDTAASPAMPISGRRRSIWYIPAAAAAIILLTAALIITLRPKPASDHTTSAAAVAMLSDISPDASFSESQSTPALGEQLPPRRFNLTAGTMQIMFRSGAVVDLISPCQFEAVGPNTGHLTSGRVIATVPRRARGFAITLPGGASAVDLGTAFSVAVDPQGDNEVTVHEGHVRVAFPSPAVATVLHQAQSLHFHGSSPIHAIVSRVHSLDDSAPTVALRDASGRPVGFTRRLPGTGAKRPDPDPALDLDPTTHTLHLRATPSDINGQLYINQAQFIGIPLDQLHIKPGEDFDAVARFAPLRDHLVINDQFGLFVGSSSQSLLRVGLIHREDDIRQAFAVATEGTHDSKSQQHLLDAADFWRQRIEFRIQRHGGVWRVLVNNHDISPGQPAFLNATRDPLIAGVFVGIGAADHKPYTMTLESFEVHTQPEPAAFEPTAAADHATP